MRRPVRDDLWWWSRHDEVARWGFTCRRGGSSEGVWGALNVARHTGDDDAAVTQNRAAVAASWGLAPERVCYMDQVHGTTVAYVSEPGQAPEQTDAMITDQPVALAVMVADCVPVLFADAASPWVGVAHAGRQGMIGGVVPETVAALRQGGASDVVAVVGPAICPRCYEVPEQMRAEVAAARPEVASVTGWGTPSLDVAAGVLAQLAELRVPCSVVPGCTAEEPELFSYRRDGQTGRLAGVVAAALR